LQGTTGFLRVLVSAFEKGGVLRILKAIENDLVKKD